MRMPKIEKSDLDAFKKTLTSEEQYEFDERAAILEYEAGYETIEAELRAAQYILFQRDRATIRDE